MNKLKRIVRGSNTPAYELDIINPEIQIGFISDRVNIALKLLREGRQSKTPMYSLKRAVTDTMTILNQAYFFGEKVLRARSMKEYYRADGVCYILVTAVLKLDTTESGDLQHNLQAIQDLRIKFQEIQEGRTNHLEELIGFSNEMVEEALRRTSSSTEKGSSSHSGFRAA